MQLKEGILIVDFLKAASHCKGNVFYRTTEQDYLNLKSKLCQYVFTASFFQSNIKNGNIVCELESDYDLLSNYLE